MNYTIEDWHLRYSRQAAWTSDLRSYIYKRIQFSEYKWILEVGCGTGALLNEIDGDAQKKVVGLDISYPPLQFAKEIMASTGLIQADGLRIPFNGGWFDVTLCHFLLLWVSYPNQCLEEMKRVTRSGGWILALAEPDYGGRIDFPQEFGQLGKWQHESLLQQGADPGMGRQLLELFVQTGLTKIQIGVLGGEWKPEFNYAEWTSEWEILEQDIGNLALQPEQEQIAELRRKDYYAFKSGRRITFVPTFYAIGQVP